MMNNKAFGEMEYNIGWKKKQAITIFEKEYTITIKAKAYYEQDGITVEQEKAYQDFCKNQNKFIKSTEELLTEYDTSQLIPQELLFQRNGEYALLFEFKNNTESGIAVVLSPKKYVVEQNEYL